jgi:ornithine cyclodeaminase/alanine dehydrogenase-like protein (mu-crystallin family)
MLPGARLRDVSGDGQAGLRYLSARDVEAAMPPIEERLRLAEHTMVALGAAELPPKIGVHPRPEASFAHAMPAYLRGNDPDGVDDLLGIKWIAGVPANRARGLPALHGLVLLADPMTGVPTALLDAGPITAERTAAISGVAIARFAPRVSGREARATIIGAGVQGHSHVAVLGHVLPGVRLTIFDRHPDRAEALAEMARATAGIGAAEVQPTARAATRAADVVVTAAAFGSTEQVMTPDWLTRDALVVPVDYATYCAAVVAREASLFIVDHREQFLANRHAGRFAGYPDPTLTLGEAIIAETPRPPVGRVVVTHLGVGLADLVFADAIVRAAVAAGRGTVLQR